MPTVALAATAPAMASSGPPPTFQFTGANKIPGNSCKPKWFKGYVFNFTVCNPSGVSIWIHTVSYVIGSDKTFKPNDNQFPIEVPANSCVSIGFNATDQGSSSNEKFDATLTVFWDHSKTGNDPNTHTPTVVSITVPETPPIPSCADATSAPPAPNTTAASTSQKTAGASPTSTAPASTAPVSTAPAAPASTAPAAPSGS
ncbi:hypothetical protein IEE94_00660 [Yimella sp. cx-573]|nr:hypothetical protein [Yimella sp. cx-573]